MVRHYALLVALVLVPLGTWAQCANIDTIYFSSFETDDGGLVVGGYGDWEWGIVPTLLTDGTCDSPPYLDPPGAHSGNNGWANNLDGCYDNSGLESTLTLTVDLSTPSFTEATLEWYQWFQVFVNFDWIYVSVNGTQVYFNDTTQSVVGWQARSVDLTPYLGQSNVAIAFVLHATAVVNKSGWYLDDMLVSVCDPPVGITDAGTIPLRVWPDPVGELLHVSLSDAHVDGWEVLDGMGRAIRSGTDPLTDPLDVSALRPGVYILRVRSTTGLAIGRFLKR
ncbi:MAG: T9SS type A sorting domain-containing protein [Flavobacteriales bacterium]|nr:T9SS type A sorting domain-containing protein [Flavobacteriales bacterium]MCB9167970.1 T9SS type A sorting domain-containing protein [Flavobacteriales bacterium]